MHSTANSYIPTTLNSSFLPSPTSSAGYRQPKQLQLPSRPSWTSEYRVALSGLRTPPADKKMGTAYQMPNMAAYENHHIHHSSYASVPPADRTRAVLNERSVPNEQLYNPVSRCPATQMEVQRQQTPHSTAPSARNSSLCSTVASSAVSVGPRSSSRQETQATTPASEQETSTRDAVMATHSLQIPTCISREGGNLSDFVADLTALFWFESIKVLETAENVRSLAPTAPPRRIPDAGAAGQNFHKWVQSVLSTTQVTQNVILLALMFIYRLKVANPTVKGRPGSEYRLLTVALMLGNKFLDDNTYTNKTWADVSGISVGEIHVMEVEFLSNMRYSLLASKEEWEEWLVKLAKFYEYMQQAQRSASPPPLLIPSPTVRGFDSSPSPTPTLQSTPDLQPTPQSVYNYSPTTTAYNNSSSQHHQHWPSANSTISPLALRPEIQPHLLRKRSFPEDDPTEPPAKRMSRVMPQHQPQTQYSTQQVPSQLPSQMSRQQQQQQQQHALAPNMQSRPDQTRLPVPSLTLNTTPAPSSQPYHGVAYAPPQASPLSLPPLVPGIRAMSTVFPPTTSTYTSQSVSGPGIPSIAPATTPATSYPPVNYGTPTKRLSPQNSLTPIGAYPASSPLSESFPRHSLASMGNVGSSSGVHTPISHSPSIYLQQRNSPYRPVRHVNTLLYPPPSAFLQQYHLVNSVPPTQMHYQPLGRRNEVRTGIVPEFAMGGGQVHAVTPQPAPYHVSQVLPNPNSMSQYSQARGQPTQSYQRN